MIAPALVYFFVFHYLPMAGLVLAFKRFNFVDGIWRSPWVGFENFRFLFISGSLWRVTRNTILYNIAFLSIGTAVEVIAAVFLADIWGKWFRKGAQTVMFLPYFISYVVVGAFVYNLFNYEHGVVNTFLTSLGFEAINAYSNPPLWIGVLIAFHTWKWVGYGSVIFLAAITNVDRDLYEAARMDGATAFEQARFVTIPLIMPTVVLSMIFQVGRIMRGQFELFYQVIGNNGNLFPLTDVVDTFVFRALVRNADIGMGSAVGLYQSAFGLVLVFSVNAIVRRINEDYALF
jgi:putative aldouronate transport system permease protein